VFSSEWDKEAAKLILKIMGLNHTVILPNKENIPPHDMLCGGFLVNHLVLLVIKGFNDARGTLFFDIARIIKYHTLK